MIGGLLRSVYTRNIAWVTKVVCGGRASWENPRKLVFAINQFFFCDSSDATISCHDHEVSLVTKLEPKLSTHPKTGALYTLETIAIKRK